MNDHYRATDVAFDSLRDKSIKDIEQYAPTSWTDHTTSDPGITILEQIIVQFTRLGEKLQLPLADLLASNGDIQQSDDSSPLAYAKPIDLNDQFFTADQVLTTAPVSLNDRRRLLLDHPLVANVLIEPIKLLEQPLYWDAVEQQLSFDELTSDHPVALPGRYRALVELVRDHGLDNDERQSLSDELLQTLQQQRNICEQWQEVIMLEPEWIKLKGSISLKTGADVEQTLIDIHQAITEYINPPLTALSKSQMQARGRDSGDIYQGPMLENGYFDEADLADVQVRKNVRVSDIIRLVMDFTQVSHVHRLQLSNSASPGDDDWCDWVLPISSGRVARLEPIIDETDLDAVLNADPNAVLNAELVVNGFIDCYKNNTLCAIDADLIAQRLADRQALTLVETEQIQWRDIPMPQGYVQDLSYSSVQQQFPVVYGLGDNALPDSVGLSRLAKVKQLQGYLLMFDQVMANYHQQLADMGQLLDSKQRPETSYSVGEFSAEDFELLTTEDYWEQIKQLVQSELTQTSHEQHNDRENRLLSHLFARLGEVFIDHSLLGFSFATDSFKQYLSGKQQCLSKIAQLAHGRFLAKDYLTGTESGLVSRLVAKLGLFNSQDHPLETPEDAPVLVEHALLYPQAATVLPVPYHNGSLVAQLSTDGKFYPVLQAPDHGLREGEVISLFAVSDDKDAQYSREYSGEYSGVYEVKIIDKDSVELDLNLNLNLDLDPDSEQIQTEFSLRWIRGTGIENPYAMQISLIFKSEMGRYQQDEFKNIVEVMARAETPAHIALNIRWLDESQVAEFDVLHSQWQTLYMAFLSDEDNDSEDGQLDGDTQMDNTANLLLAFLSEDDEAVAAEQLAKATELDIAANQLLAYLL